MNYAKRPVTLLGGPALAASATVSAVLGAPAGARAATAVVGTVSGLVGGYDDLAGARPEQARDKGLAGHLAALKAGRVSAGAVKVAGIGAAAAAAALLTRRRPGPGALADAFLTTGLVAGTANLLNLLDLRPGRAGKAGVLLAATTLGGPSGELVAGPLGATLAVLPEDLGERVMLGDSGANALGALLGLRLAAIPGRAPRAGLLAAVVALTLASEKVSFTTVIEATPDCVNWTASAAARREQQVSGRTAVRGVAGAAVMIAVLTLLARLAGFGRTLVFTNAVGANSTGDVYLAANTVPNIVFEVVAGGALASLVVPMLAGGIATGDRKQVRQTASALLGWSLLILTPLAVGIALAAEPIAELLLGKDNSVEVALAARFLLVFAPQVVLYGIGIVLAGVLQAHRRFAGPALAPLLSSVLVSAAYLLFAGIGGSREVGGLTTPAELVLSVGTTLGVVVLSLSLLLPIRGLRLGLRPALRFPVGVAPRVRRLALAGVLTLAGQQAVAAVAIRLASGGPHGTQVVYFAGMTLFLLPWAALAVPLATSAYPGLAERAEVGDETGYRSALAPAAVLTVASAAVAAGVLVAVSGPMARVFLVSSPARQVAALRDTIVAFAPGLVGYALVALLTRALYARGLWRAPTVAVVGGWLLAVVSDVVLARALPPEHRALALGAGHSIGVTVAGLGLLAVVARVAGRDALHGVARSGAAALAGGGLGAAVGLFCARALGADPVPTSGILSAIGVGVVAATIVLVIAGAVMMVTARAALTEAVHALRRPDDVSAATTGGTR